MVRITISHLGYFFLFIDFDVNFPNTKTSCGQYRGTKIISVNLPGDSYEEVANLLDVPGQSASSEHPGFWRCQEAFQDHVPSLKLTFSHLKRDGWTTIVSFWDGLFSGAMLVSGSVSSLSTRNHNVRMKGKSWAWHHFHQQKTGQQKKKQYF